MGDEQGEGVGFWRPLVDGVNSLAVDSRGDLIEGVDPGLGGSPVEAIGPVVGQAPKPSQIAAVIPSRVIDLVGPPGVG